MNPRFLPHTPEDVAEMLAVVGAPDLESLFDAVPPDCRRSSLDLPPPLDEWRLRDRMAAMAEEGGDWRVYVNAGSQRHHIPALVPAMANRSEFLTAYTPYQPEMSQGTLQAIFEYQTLVARLTGMDVANASMYDGATAMAESVLMAQRITKRDRVVVSSQVHPAWREVLTTYLAPSGVDIVYLPATSSGATEYDVVRHVKEPAVLVMQSPNFFGVIEDLGAAAKAVHGVGGLLAAGCSEPYALGLIKSPGAQGVDIAFGEGQSLGLAQSFGGPGLGLMAAKAAHLRQIPGRLVGETVDNRGQRGFVLTLSTREQHIRRGRAVSNICSNAGHAALTAAVFMAAAGGGGFRRLAAANRDAAEYLKAGLMELGFAELFSGPTFNEFVLRAPDGFASVHARLLERRIVAGHSLRSLYPELDGAWLFGVTETSTRDDLDGLLALIKELSDG